MTSYDRLTADEIIEIRQALVDTHLESIELRRLESMESGNHLLLEEVTNNLLTSTDIREVSVDDISVLARQYDASNLLRWWVHRMSVALHTTSVDPNRVDDHLAKGLVFTPMHIRDNEYLTNKYYTSSDMWKEAFMVTPLLRLMAALVSFKVKLYAFQPEPVENTND